MSLLKDEREKYVVGGIAKGLSNLVKKAIGKKSPAKQKQEKMNELINAYKDTYQPSRLERLGDDEAIASQREAIEKELNRLLQDMDDVFDKNIENSTGYTRYDWLDDKLKGYPGIKKPDNRIIKQEGGEMDNQMMMIMSKPTETEVEPDGEMEENYTDFIMSEALTEEEEDMLTQKLEQDEQLAMLFDKVIDVAQEFAGSGPVEGPGSGVSDSIPARLSDGEFVFTAKAVEEIGADELMRMMKDAEMKADERQQAYDGGLMNGELEKVVQTETRITKPADATSPALGATEDNLIQEEVTRNMLDPRVQHVRS